MDIVFPTDIERCMSVFMDKEYIVCKRKTIKKTLSIVFIMILLILIIVPLNIIAWWTFDISHSIPDEVFLESYYSDDNYYEFILYYIPGGSTVGDTYRGVVKYGKKTRGIYFNDDEHHSDKIYWVDNRHICIGDIVLDVENDRYDFRHNRITATTAVGYLQRAKH